MADLSNPWDGSHNQRFHFLTPRYRWLESTLSNIPKRLEVCVFPDGRVWTNGMASIDVLSEILDDAR